MTCDIRLESFIAEHDLPKLITAIPPDHRFKAVLCGRTELTDIIKRITLQQCLKRLIDGLKINKLTLYC